MGPFWAVIDTVLSYLSKWLDKDSLIIVVDKKTADMIFYA